MSLPEQVLPGGMPERPSVNRQPVGCARTRSWRHDLGEARVPDGDGRGAGHFLSMRSRACRPLQSGGSTPRTPPDGFLGQLGDVGDRAVTRLAISSRKLLPQPVDADVTNGIGSPGPAWWGLRCFHRELPSQVRESRRMLNKDRDALLTFYDFPAEHWKHLRTPTPSKACSQPCAPPHAPVEGMPVEPHRAPMVFKLVSRSKKLATPRRQQPLPKLISRCEFADGLELAAKRPTVSRTVAA